jgi:hypothetical protein
VKERGRPDKAEEGEGTMQGRGGVTGVRTRVQGCSRVDRRSCSPKQEVAANKPCATELKVLPPGS